MTAEQLIEKLQELIGKGTISPIADIRIRTDFEDYDELEIVTYFSGYTRLYIEVS